MDYRGRLNNGTDATPPPQTATITTSSSSNKRRTSSRRVKQKTMLDMNLKKVGLAVRINRSSMGHRNNSSSSSSQDLIYIVKDTSGRPFIRLSPAAAAEGPQRNSINRRGGHSIRYEHETVNWTLQ